MSKRERFLGLVFLFFLLVIAHLFIGAKIKQSRTQQEVELSDLEAKLAAYSSMKPTVTLIQDEVDWVDQHSPPLTSYEKAQTDLNKFLKDSSNSLGFSIFNTKLSPREESFVQGAIYQRVKIQISARATEKQIYQWLVNIHQPQKMRMINYLKLSPPVNDSDLIECQIIAEQYITSE